MKRITLEKIKDALLYEQFEIKLDPEIVEKGRMAVQRMLEVSYK